MPSLQRLGIRLLEKGGGSTMYMQLTSSLWLARSFVSWSPFVVVVTNSVAWELGLKRQLQVVGFTLSMMDLCRRVVMPKVFLMTEAQFGKSHLQNYDAILRNSVVVSHMAFLWRVVLFSLIILPTGLSLAYKEFFVGTTSKILQKPGGHYGLAAPGSLAITGGTPDGGILGVSAMVNATLPYIQAAADDSKPPTPPELEYIIGGQDKNDTLAPRARYRLPFVGQRIFRRGFQQQGTGYEMIGR